MKGHQMVPNGEFPQLSPLQMMQQQTTSSCEDMAFGYRKFQLRSNFTDILLAVGMWANQLTSLGFSFLMCKRENCHHIL